MNAKDFGGNSVSSLSLEQKSITFSEAPYYYSTVRLESDESFAFDQLSSFTIFVYALDDGATISIQTTGEQLKLGDVLQAEKQGVELQTCGGSARLLIAGVPESVSAENVVITRASELKRVEKPWGYELWLNGQHPGYALKKILLRKGFKTSLQYHRQKQETNILFEGVAALHYKSNPNIDNDDVGSSDVTSVQVSAPTSISVSPPTLHRIEAIEDVILCETSTPHLDDVIRVSDDTNREHGRIDSEHQAARG